MKHKYLCYRCALTIERLADVVIHADNGATFKFQINPSYLHSTNPANLLFVCVFYARHIYRT